MARLLGVWEYGAVVNLEEPVETASLPWTTYLRSRKGGRWSDTGPCPLMSRCLIGTDTWSACRLIFFTFWKKSDSNSSKWESGKSCSSVTGIRGIKEKKGSQKNHTDSNHTSTATTELVCGRRTEEVIYHVGPLPIHIPLLPQPAQVQHEILTSGRNALGVNTF